MFRRWKWMAAVLAGLFLVISMGVWFWGRDKGIEGDEDRPGDPQRKARRADGSRIAPLQAPDDEPVPNSKEDSKQQQLASQTEKTASGDRQRRRMGAALLLLHERARREAPYGMSPPVDVEASPQAASVAEALRTGRHFERINPLAPLPLFDRENYLKDPSSYLNIAMPGRVFQTAQPGENVHGLVRLSQAFQRIDQGDSTDLVVKAEPKMPVTFTSFNLGQFPDQLTTISVAADDRGIARTTFTASSGTHGDVRILAGSPTSTGQVEFLLVVSMPAK